MQRIASFLAANASVCGRGANSTRDAPQTRTAHDSKIATRADWSIEATNCDPLIVGAAPVKSSDHAFVLLSELTD